MPISLQHHIKMMKKLIRKLSRASHHSDVPSGHVPVYAGVEQQRMERFIVNAKLLHHPVFRDLLDRAAQEYGYAHTGGALKIPVNAHLFHRLLHHLHLGLPLHSLNDVVL